MDPVYVYKGGYYVRDVTGAPPPALPPARRCACGSTMTHVNDRGARVEHSGVVVWQHFYACDACENCEVAK